MSAVELDLERELELAEVAGIEHPRADGRVLDRDVVPLAVLAEVPADGLDVYQPVVQRGRGVRVLLIDVDLDLAQDQVAVRPHGAALLALHDVVDLACELARLLVADEEALGFAEEEAAAF